MEIKYRREARKTFMHLGSTGDGTGYEERMMQHLRHENLLPFHIDYAENEKRYYYEISALQPLERIAEQGGITACKLKMLILQLDHILGVLEKHLMSDAALLLHPQTIYLDQEQERFRFCTVPGGNYHFTEQMRALCLFLLPHFTEGSDAVLICHAMFKASLKENFSSRQLLCLLFEQHKPVQQTEPETERITEIGVNEKETEINWKEDQEKHQEKHQEKNGTERNMPVLVSAVGGLRQILICLAIFLTAPVIIFLLRGREAVMRMLPVFCVAGIGLLLYFLLQYIEKKKQTDGEEVREHEPKALTFHKGDVTGFGYSEEGHGYPQGSDRGSIPLEENKTEESGSTFSTRQLWEIERNAGTDRRLVPLNKELPEILLDHFPFIIGKNKQSSDFALRDERVSHIHLQFCKEGEQYFMTDLNSANGTKLGEYLMNANETVPIQPGQEISIAGIGYVFV